MNPSNDIKHSTSTKDIHALLVTALGALLRGENSEFYIRAAMAELALLANSQEQELRGITSRVAELEDLLSIEREGLATERVRAQTKALVLEGQISSLQEKIEGYRGDVLRAQFAEARALKVEARYNERLERCVGASSQAYRDAYEHATQNLTVKFLSQELSAISRRLHKYEPWDDSILNRSAEVHVLTNASSPEVTKETPKNLTGTM